MKTTVSTAAFAILLAAVNTSHASDLSFTFQVLDATQHSSAPAAQTTLPAPAPVAPRLLLGAWLTDVDGRLQVSETIPGSPAAQTLQPGDVLYRITSVDGRTRTLRTLHQFEYAKRQLGPNRQSLLEVYRPGVGMIPMNVTFAAAPGGLADIALSHPQPAVPAATGKDAQGLANR